MLFRSPMEPGPIPMDPGPGPRPGSLSPAGVAVPDDFPPDLREADIYLAHPAGPLRASDQERRYFPPPDQLSNVFEMGGGSVRRGAASITGTLPRHASQRARRARAAAVVDYFTGARYMGMRRVVGTEFNIFPAPTVPSNSGPPRRSRPPLQQPPGAYLASDDNDDRI